ncbi:MULTISPECIES: DEAD/DEAH box helicase family protein [unclassified Paenibacillus]|uniref:DEAD/DEAH box helicase family protein n=1 Tax=unclassified Paenibacillus TaxID=185978 RepID=UPI001AE56A2F|nr:MULTISPECIES: DEAD/DEAH box helicase family protein [unclassified Paenibacillus]MBP1153641.1 type I restriction enzyme R subunit [Paenibacillus sp. PvP091]MBP1170974.1 type I restriction enzyme R subunit [Paenibacillus sp. PvR098]MBP2442002.1 type I restriction enzyme R subunit [Paenibacillus sp. PvP052]
MTSNFEFLQGQTEYVLFATACIEAERVLATSPAMAAVGSRKAFELAVKWVYAADNTITMPYKDNLQSLIHEPSFRFAMENQTWGKLPYIIKLGNLAVHTDKAISRGDAVLSLSALFEFVQWIDYCYGASYEERSFFETNIPSEKVVLDEAKIKEKDSLIEQKDSEIEALRAKIAAMSDRLTADKDQHQAQRHFTPEDISEFNTRKRYIDVDLKLLGWTFGDDVREEVVLYGMPNHEEKGYADYVLYGKDGLPLAIIEAKRTSKDPKIGTHQAKLYADCLEKMTGRRPMMFTTNGFETNLWDDVTSPQRKVSGIFSKSDLEKLMNRRTERKELDEVVIDDKITDRYYQKEAIRAVGESITIGHRRALLVMATGTGKTRTASSLTDVLSRGGYVTNTLFLADRTALVKQAKDDFKNYLPHMSLCNLLSNKDDKTARIVFSTYPTMLNAIDKTKSDDGKRLFTPAHFDLIVVDEAHRSIFKKYRTIFEYFDGLIVGLTATPKTEVDRNTYDFFEMESGVPTYAYAYETAVEIDHVLVPYYNIEITTKFLEKGITYDDLSPEDKARYEEDFTDEDGEMPEFIPSPAVNEFIFNQATVDRVLEDLMTKGIKVAGGDRLGKTIIFAQNKKHAQYIVERFDKLYPQYNGSFAKRIISEDSYAQSIIDDFKVADKGPHIAVSVDMLDTGIDVPEIVNLVFFKRIRSKTKFWQMIGRGTRLRKNLFGEGEDKTQFVIFDYLGNFEFFRQHQEGLQGSETQSLSEAIFAKRVRLIHHTQQSVYINEPYQAIRTELIEKVVKQINFLNPELVSVKMQLQYVEKYKHKTAFVSLSDVDKSNLIAYLAPIVYMDDTDEYAKRFDNFMYGLMLAHIEGSAQMNKAKKQLMEVSSNLLQRATIPQIKEKLELISTIGTDEFWQSSDLLNFEKVRIELRSLIKFIIDEGSGRNPIYTNLADEVLTIEEGKAMYQAYDFEDYKLKVNRYIEKNRDTLAIHKLRNNIPLTSLDYESLEKIFTGELGTAEDYQREYQNTPFGLLVRKIAKLEYEAATVAFSEFINDQSLSQAQIVFVKKVIDYIVQNGYIDNVSELTKPPFDKPLSFVKLFDGTKQKRLVEMVAQIKDNAIKILS